MIETKSFVLDVITLYQHRPILLAFQAMPLASLFALHNVLLHHLNGVGQDTMLIIEVRLEIPRVSHSSLSIRTLLPMKSRSRLSSDEDARNMVTEFVTIVSSIPKSTFLRLSSINHFQIHLIPGHLLDHPHVAG